jgi:hypothetical protein
MSTIKQDMPLLASNEGVWEGVYRHVGPDGELVDVHRSRLICRFPATGDFPYHQTNIYTWDDGRREIREYPCRYVDGSKALIFLNDLIDGWAKEITEDPRRRTLMLSWFRPDMREILFYEMINVSDCGTWRTRVWQWLKDGRVFRRTLIDEQRVSTDWRAYESYR